MPRFFKNEYRYKKLVKDFAKQNPIGKFLRPLLRSASIRFGTLLPQPRDFLIRRFPMGGTGAEIGVYNGDFSERIERICRPGLLFLIDPWLAIADRTEEQYNQHHQDLRYALVREKFAEPIALGRLVPVRKTSDQAVALFDDGQLDFAYIDGDHRYEQVKSDLVNYFPKIKRGGLLCGDDYHIVDVQRAVDAFALEQKLQCEVRNRQFILKRS